MDKLKLKITKVGERIDKFTVNVTKTAREKRTECFYQARVQLLESYWSQYLTLFDELLDTATSVELKEDDYFASDKYTLVECAYSEALAWLNEQINKLKSSTVDNSLNSTLRTSNDSQAVKLPKISLPSFSGSYLEWPTFRDTYVSLIHENQSLADVQKLHYLRALLSGEASKLLQHLSLTDANYIAAWEILLNRYDNTRALINSNLSALINIASMSSESASELRRVLDSFTQAVRALENLKRPVKEWNDWLVYFLSSKLDNNTRKDWETSLVTSTDPPSFESIETFLEGRIHTLNAIKESSSSLKLKLGQRPIKHNSRVHQSTTSPSCLSCQGKHFLLFCPQFRSKSIDERITFLRSNKLCNNCLKPNHTVTNCQSINRCKFCQQKHHTMIHKSATCVSKPTLSQSSTSGNQQFSAPNAPSTTTSAGEPIGSEPSALITKSHLSNSRHRSPSVLLATAIVYVRSRDNRLLKARALLDQGSESSFISTALANILRLPRQRVNISVTGVGAREAGVVKSCVNHEITSTLDPKKTYSVQSLVLPTLTHLLPSQNIENARWPHLEGLVLADPTFDKPSRIDLILGAKIYAQILQGAVKRGVSGSPVAQSTTLGWILSGPVKNSSDSVSTLSLHTSTANLDHFLRKFWEVEEPPQLTPLTAEEEECEQLFASTHSRTADGRYIVRLPLKSPATLLGHSHEAAESFLRKMENRFQRDSNLFEGYRQFMTEYLQLGHMRLISEEDNTTGNSYYLPHHCVIKSSSSTTKLRVVFNASQKTTSGLSLNDIMHTGPKLQNDVFSVVLKWRFFRFALSADIEKMYRQILVDDKDTNLQRILWRNHPSEPIHSYRLLTVTYGTASAPYLACRTLAQLASDHQHTHPEAAKILQENFYVDDALFGAHDKGSAIRLRNELLSLLRQGGFNLRKWISNSADILVDKK